MNNIHPIFDSTLGRKEKEALLEQKAAVLWLTGLSGSGKSTIAKNLEKSLHAKGYMVKLLDGDNIRSGINGDLGFSVEERKENIRRVSEIAKLFLDAGVICIVSFISPTVEIRKMAAKIIGEDDFYEVYVNCPLEVCEERDVKGLYKKARAGLIPDFTGIHSPFEASVHPAVELKTDKMSVEAGVALLERFVIEEIQKES